MFLLKPFSLCYKYRFLLAYTTMMEIRSLYAGSALGMFWLFLGPLLFLILYALVYTVIFKIQPKNMDIIDYVFYVFCGLLSFLSFSSSLTQGATSISKNKHVLLNTLFPVELLPIRTVLMAHLPLCTGFLFLFCAGLYFGMFSWMWLWIPFLILLQALALSGVAMLLSLITLVLKDIEQIMPYLVMAFMVITPIAYTPDMVPFSLKIVCYLNPLFYFTHSFQYVFVFHSYPPLEIIAGLFIMSIGSFAISFFIFQKVKSTFYDMA